MRVISWALGLATPVTLAIVAADFVLGPHRDFAGAGGRAWLGFAYVAVVSAYVGFFPWYAGLARGGVARVGQVQLVQPVLSLAWAALLLGEPLRGRTVLAALLVVTSAGAAVLLRPSGGNADAGRRSTG